MQRHEQNALLTLLKSRLPSCHVKRILTFAAAMAFWAFITPDTAHAQGGPTKTNDAKQNATRLEASRRPAPGPPVREEIKRKPTTTGALTQLSSADTLFQLFNPLAPDAEAKAEENTPETPIDKKRPGFRGLLFLKFSW